MGVILWKLSLLTCLLVQSTFGNASFNQESQEEMGTEFPQESGPDPPTNLQTDLNGQKNILFRWDPPENGKYTSFQIKLDPITNILEGPQRAEKVPIDFFSQDLSLKINLEDVNLLPGSSYRIRIYTQFHTPQQFRLSSEALEGNFTLRPNPPDRFVVWYRNETSFLVLWQPPTYGFFYQYKAEIYPRESTESTIYVSKDKYQAGEVRPGFFNLTPGKAYNITVVTISEGQESIPLVKEYRTIPLKPENLSVTLVGPVESQKQGNRPASVVVQWLPPSDELGDFDGFNVYIKHEWVKPVQKFVSRTKPPKARLEDPGLKVGQTYEVVVKTVSGKVSSSAVSQNFTFLPNSIIH